MSQRHDHQLRADEDAPMNLPATALFGDASEGALQGRRAECDMLDRLVADAWAGRSRALILRGEAGIGKTALLNYLVKRAAGCRVALVTGAEPEMGMAFAGLHQLCAPLLDRVGHLPDPQGDALRIAFSMQSGIVPDHFTVGMAVLALLSDAASERPLICVVDDAHWLDSASAGAVAFVARHVATHAVPAAVVLAVREPANERGFAGVPEFQLRGLTDADARRLLESVVIGPLDEQVRHRIIAEARGTPAALLEPTRGMTPGELAGGFGVPAAVAAPSWIEEGYRRQFALLPAATQLLLVVAAVEPAGDAVLVWRAAGHLGVRATAAEPAAAAGLLDFSGQLRFAGPQARSAVYRAATPQQRRSAHGALAETAGSDVGSDQRAWHRAHAVAHPDEAIAAQLARSVGRARARGGLAAGAAFGERAAELTPEPTQRARRALDAAEANWEAGAPATARRLLAMAQGVVLDDLTAARAELLRARLAARPGPAPDGWPLLLDAARRLEPLDAGLAREAYREAFVGGRAMSGRMTEVARAVRTAATTQPARATDLLLDGLAALVTDGHRVGTPTLKRAVRAFRDEGAPGQQALPWLAFACWMSRVAWDDDSWHYFSARLTQLARQAGALRVLPDALQDGAALHLASGETAMAMAMAREADLVTGATGNPLRPYAGVLVAAWRGQKAEISRLVAAKTTDAAVYGDGLRVAATAWAAAVLNNGLSRYDDALVAAEQASADPAALGLDTWALAELIEAATRTGARESAVSALHRLSTATSAAGTDWALGIQARSRALLSSDEDAEHQYLEAIERLTRTRLRAELARAHLLYGEWLRRQGRRRDAREQLRTAHLMLDAMGLDGFAERAQKELAATNETSRKRTVETANELTAQEVQIATLATEGRTNPEIGAQLFISSRTVEWHLRKVFVKLGISSRRELRTALPELITTAA
jgi:DNA-binding CsgD family transcriptional regulator